jgi:hypothetical protein
LTGITSTGALSHLRRIIKTHQHLRHRQAVNGLGGCAGQPALTLTLTLTLRMGPGMRMRRRSGAWG